MLFSRRRRSRCALSLSHVHQRPWVQLRIAYRKIRNNCWQITISMVFVRLMAVLLPMLHPRGVPVAVGFCCRFFGGLRCRDWFRRPPRGFSRPAIPRLPFRRSAAADPVCPCVLSSSGSAALSVAVVELVPGRSFVRVSRGSRCRCIPLRRPRSRP